MSSNEVKRPQTAPSGGGSEIEEKIKQLEVGEDENIPSVCRLCGAILKYNGLGEYKCPDCGHTEYDSYGIVRNYLETHPGANILQVERGTGIPRAKITKMIAEDRFRISNNRVSLD